MPSTSVPTRVSRSTSLKRPSDVASIWQCSGSAAGSSSWIEFDSARPMVTTPASNSKTRSSLSDRQTVSLGMSDRHFRGRRGETEGRFSRTSLLRADLLEELLDLAARRPSGGRQLEGPGEVLGGAVLVAPGHPGV